MRLWVDIETIPTQRDDLKKLCEARVEPPGNIKKPESIAKWWDEHGADAVEQEWLKTALDPFFGEIICAAIAVDDQDPVAVWRKLEDPESHVLIQLRDELIEQMNASQSIGAPRDFTICGFNVLDFDLRFLAVRYAIHRVKPAHRMMHLGKLNAVKPWSDDVLDVMTYAAGPRGRISMDRLGQALGLGGKGDMDGSKVWDAVRDGRVLDVVDYCRQDVEKTRNLYYALGGV